jgi:methyl-accepting chemotaxis protein
MRLSVRYKLGLLILVFGLVPAGIIGFLGYRSTVVAEENSYDRMREYAESIADKIDRNLFERYGDVQAFGTNQSVQKREDWYLTDAETALVRAMNQYVNLYDIYSLSILVDPEGKVIAVNTKDSNGQPINTAFIYGQNYASAPWFQACKAGTFTTEMPFTAEENKKSTGTFIEDLHMDADVKKAYPSEDGYTLGFSAPVFDDQGQVIAIWSNRTKFSGVEDIFVDFYRDLKDEGFLTLELTLLDKDGRVIVDYDPMLRKGDETVHHDPEVILNLNLAEKGVLAAKEAVAGKKGTTEAMHARKKIVQISGYIHLSGAMGYPGMNWSVLVRISKDEFAPMVKQTRKHLVQFGVLIIAVVLCVGLLVGRSATRPLLQIAQGVTAVASGDLEARFNIKSNDELGDLGTALNEMVTKLKASFSESTRLIRMIDDMPLNVMFADNDFNLTYLNNASKKTLKTLEKWLPAAAEDLLGKCIDIFHKNPAHQRNIMADPKNFPIRSVIQLGEEKLSLLTTEVRDAQGARIGFQNSWAVVTAQKRLEDELTRCVQDLQSASSSMSEVSSTMASAAEETSNQAQVVSSAAEQVNANTSTVAASAEEMTASIREISSNSSEAANVARRAVEMANITNTTIGDLGQQSREIGNVIKVISSIAQQTNLLALNATIEAARAGEAGKGFAVVANEVKELAKQTANATGEITTKIEAIQSSTSEAVTAIQEISQIIGQINDISVTIASAVEEQAATTNEITRNVAESAKGAEEIASNIIGVATAATSTAEGANQSLRSASSVNGIAASLAKLLEQLKSESKS